MARGLCKRCTTPVVPGGQTCHRHLMQDREWNRNRARRLYRERTALGLCPTCGKRPPTFSYVQCQLCRQNNLDGISMRLADVRIEYEENMHTNDHYTLRETAKKCGLEITQMRRHIDKGTMRAIKDRWGRLWVYSKDRNNFLRHYVRGYRYGSV